MRIGPGVRASSGPPRSAAAQGKVHAMPAADHSVIFPLFTLILHRGEWLMHGRKNRSIRFDRIPRVYSRMQILLGWGFILNNCPVNLDE